MLDKITSDLHYRNQLGKILETLDIYSIGRDDIIELLLAMSFNNKHGVVPSSTHLKLVDLFCRSSGLIQETIHKFRHSPIQDTLNSIVLQSENVRITASDFTNIIADLKNIGYATLPCSLHKNICDEILSYAYLQQHTCLARYGSQNRRYEVSGLDELQPYTLSAAMKESCINASNTIHIIINDPVILGLVSFYLRTKICVRSVSFWHSFEAIDHEPYGELAQLFHYDLDEFRWLKLFIFLTDVSDNNGPHVFIPGSHRPGFKDPKLLSRGYARISDDDMDRYHPRSSWKYLTCSAGTLVLADTRCWHKGTAVKTGVRSLLQPEYAPTKFSMNLI